MTFEFPRRSDRVMNLGHFLTQAAGRRGDHPAMIRGDIVRTYADMNARADAIAHALTKMGIGKGDRVLMHSANELDYPEAMYAVWKVGGVIVPTNFRLGPDEIARMGIAAGAKAFVGDTRFADHVEAVREAGFAGDCEIIIGGSYDDLVATHAHDGPCREAEVDYNDPAWFFFTSGTTGNPKMAVLTHGQLAFVFNNHAADLMPGLSHADASLVIAPLSHGAGLHLFIQVTRCATNVLMSGDGLDPAEAWALIEKHRISNMFTVPTIVKRLVEHEAVHRHDTSSLRHLIYAGAPMYRADQKKALEVLGPVLVQYFGMGEVTGAIAWLPADEHSTDDGAMRVGSCGFARMGMELAILGDGGTALPVGETGVIATRGPAVCAGYYDNDAANDQAFVNGWFITGDVGHMDAGGYLYITGRLADLYLSGGSNIHPREVEEKLLEHEAIAEAAIVGVPDAQWGEVGAAALVVAPGATMDEATLRTWIAAHVPRYKQPAYIVFWDELPKSGYGKVEKKTVKARLIDTGAVPAVAAAQ
ncbi:MAG: AMP-binding protein [Roseitalea sp.]|nr:AMP-binding protein [Roseitalea sp.]